MIDWEKSAELNRMGVDDLKVWLDKYPNSNKKVWRVCEGEGCNDERALRFCQYGDFCHKCTLMTKKVRKNMSEGAKTRLPTSYKTRLNMSVFQKKRYEDPEEIQKKREIMIKLWEDPEYRKKQKHSPDQLCRHHVAYDFNDPDALVVIVTRRRHGEIHHPKGIGIHQRGYSLID